MNTEHKSNTPTEIRDLWQTPQALFDYYNDRFDFDLDAAASASNALVDEYYDIEDDSISSVTSWLDRNWCNPPYSDIQPWVSKAIEQMNEGKLTVMLIPSDTSVKWFKSAFDSCSECHFISGRISFINAETKKPVNGNNKGSVVFIFNPESPFKSQSCLLERDEIMGLPIKKK
jgi:phage N-6-adenine-methyltransferase